MGGERAWQSTLYGTAGSRLSDNITLARLAFIGAAPAQNRRKG
jgi:hypothetical protein